MKVEKIEPLTTFTPIKLEITIETEKELSALYYMAGLNQSIPDLIKKQIEESDFRISPSLVV